MKIKERYYSDITIREINSNVGQSLIRLTASNDEQIRLEQLTEIVGRMLDKLGLTDQEMLDLIDPYGAWELVK
jgi:hypothetical protein